MNTDVTEIAETSEDRQLTDLFFILLQQFTQAMIADDAVLNEVPYGVTLVLLPDDRPDYVAVVLQEAQESARIGKNVYIRHMYRQRTDIDEQGDPIYSPYRPEPEDGAAIDEDKRRLASVIPR